MSNIISQDDEVSGLNYHLSLRVKPFHREKWNSTLFAGIYTGFRFDMFLEKGVVHREPLHVYTIGVPLVIRLPEFTYAHFEVTLLPVFYFSNQDSFGSYLFISLSTCAGIHEWHLCLSIYPVDLFGMEKMGGIKGSSYFTLLSF